MKKTTQVIHFGEELQNKQEGWDYQKKKYNSWADGSQISIGYTLKLILTGYIIHLADTNLFREHSLRGLPLPSESSLPLFQFLLKPAPDTRSLDQVDISR